jgi:hypothetical protein
VCLLVHSQTLLVTVLFSTFAEKPPRAFKLSLRRKAWMLLFLMIGECRVLTITFAAPRIPTRIFSLHQKVTLLQLIL